MKTLIEALNDRGIYDIEKAVNANIRKRVSLATKAQKRKFPGVMPVEPTASEQARAYCRSFEALNGLVHVAVYFYPACYFVEDNNEELEVL